MAKIIDNVILNTLLFAIFTVWATYLTKNLFIGMSISLIIVLIIAILIKPKKKAKINPDDYVAKLVTTPLHKQIDLFFSILSPNVSPVLKKGNVTINSDTLFMPYLKFAKINADEIYGKARKAKFSGFKKLILVVNEYDEKDYQKIKQYLPISVELIDVRCAIYALDKANLLPDVPNNKAERPKLSVLFKSAIGRKNFKYFLLSGLSLALLSVLTPLKLYYLTFCTISLSLAILCIIKRKTQKPTYFI